MSATDLEIKSDIGRYLPEYILEYREMKSITDTENTELDRLKAAILRVRENMFVETSDEPTVTRLEKALGIKTDRTKDLSLRKAVILSYYIRTNKLSETVIREVVRTFTGAECDISVANDILTVIVERGDYDLVCIHDIIAALEDMKPEELILDGSVGWSPTVLYTCGGDILNYGEIQASAESGCYASGEAV